MAKVGVSNLHYAIQQTEDTATAAATYGTPVAIKGTVNVDVQVASETATLYADNGPYESAAGMGEITVSLELADLELADQAALLGHTVDSQTGQLDKKTTDTAPYVALAFEFLMANGKKRAVKLYKGKFTEPGETGQTKEASPNFQTQSISAAFVQLKNNAMWESVKDFDANAATDSWYASVL